MTSVNVTTTQNTVTVTEGDTSVVTVTTAGPQGAQGEGSATVTIGTTTTGSAGSNASVTNTGSATEAVLNFTIPAGAAGAAGPAGATGPQGDRRGRHVPDGPGGRDVGPLPPRAPHRALGRGDDRRALPEPGQERPARDRLDHPLRPRGPRGGPRRGRAPHRAGLPAQLLRDRAPAPGAHGPAAVREHHRPAPQESQRSPQFSR